MVKKLCLTTNKIVFDNKQIALSKNYVWRQKKKLYLKTSKLYCQKIVFDDQEKNCIWKQENCIVNKLYLTTTKIIFDNKNIVLSKNCVWRPKNKLYLKTRKLYFQKIVFDDKQTCIWQQTNCIVVSSPPYPWQQANCIVKKLFDDQKQNCILKQENCIVKKLYLTTSKIVFDNKQIVL